MYTLTSVALSGPSVCMLSVFVELPTNYFDLELLLEQMHALSKSSRARHCYLHEKIALDFTVLIIGVDVADLLAPSRKSGNPTNFLSCSHSQKIQLFSTSVSPACGRQTYGDECEEQGHHVLNLHEVYIR